MARINLLPWREELRKERQKQFSIALGFAALAGAAVVGAGVLHTEQLISHQQARNSYLKSEIAIVDKKIEEIKELQATKDRLIARMQIIERLQQSRPQVVHLFDELVRTLPNGVHLKSIEQKGASVEVKGIAESSARVSAYMRNIEASEWLKDAKLGGIEAITQGRVRRSEFTLSMKQDVKGEVEEGGEE